MVEEAQATAYKTSEGIWVEGVKTAPPKPVDPPIGEDLIVDSRDRALKGEDFMKILVFQLKNQNPLEPMSSGEMLGQISSLSSVRLSESLELFTRNQNNTLGQGLLGKNVVLEALDAQGKPKIVEGMVSSVLGLGQEHCQLMVNGQKYNVMDVVKVQASNKTDQAVSNYLGKRVVLKEIDPKTFKENFIEGEVTALMGPQTENCRLVVNGKQYDPSHVVEIRLSDSPPVSEETNWSYVI